MTQDEIIRMAQEAGFHINESLFPEAAADKYIGTSRNLERFATLVAQNYMAKACGSCVIKQCYKRMDAEIEAAVLAEREACAKVCEIADEYCTGDHAAAIRARSRARSDNDY